MSDRTQPTTDWTRPTTVRTRTRSDQRDARTTTLRGETMLGEEAAFIRAILADSDDLTPRLVYADWLDEQGMPALADRAEFIRLGCQLALWPADHPGQAVWQVRYDELWARHRRAWLAQLPEVPFIAWQPFTCGFPEGLTVSNFESFQLAAHVLFATAPIRRVVLLPEFGRASGWTHAMYLHYRRQARADMVRDCPWLAKLRELDLSGNDGPAGRIVRAVIQSRWLPAIRSLKLDCNIIQDRHISELLERPLPLLESLSLARTQLTEVGALALVRSPNVPALRFLNLSNLRQIDSRDTYQLQPALVA